MDSLSGWSIVDNPYQTPIADLPESAAAKHRSFRLTHRSATPDATVTVGTFREAIGFSLVQQLPILLLSALLLDGGLVFKRVSIASVAFWILTLMIMVRHRKMPNISNSDILLVKWGYLPLLLGTCILWFVASAIMP